MTVKKLFALLLSSLILFLLFVPGFSVLASDTAELYVSPDGDDKAAGTIDAPLATLFAAKEKAKSIDGKVTVYFREGTYLIEETVRFDETDKSDVLYRSYNGEKVMFTSGKPYTGFEECEVNGVRAFRKNVGTDADFNILFNEETTLTRPRYPESGYLLVRDTLDSDCIKIDDPINYVHSAYCGMIVNKEDFRDFKNISDITVKLLHYWKDETLPVSAYDSETGHVSFKKYTSMMINKNDRFFLDNVFEAMNTPGEWYLDRSEGILYVIPEADETPEGFTVRGSETETMISVDGVDGISFEGILFRANGFSYTTEREHSQAAYDATPCVSYERAKNFSLKNCEFRDIAACAVFLGEAVQNAEVDSCLFDNIGAQAVYIRGKNISVDDPNVTKNIAVTNNLISKFGRVFYNAVGVLVIHANTVDVSHNEIHDGYYTAISVGWVWGYTYSVTYNNRICDNLIYNIGQGWLSDMGGIYTLGNQPGTVLSGNVIHNVTADPNEGGYGGWGIYLDEGSSYILVEKNLVYACGSDAYHLHFGSYNTVRNNIFALSGESQVRVVSAPDRVIPDDGGKETANFSRNILLSDSKVCAFSFLQRKEAYSESENIFWDLSEGKDVYVTLDYNKKRAMGIRTAVRKGYITEPTIADPMFKNAAEFDFELNPDSPAIKAGFEAWDYGNAGTLKGTTVGLSLGGGQTPYNAHSACVPMTQAKERYHCIMEFFCSVCDLFNKIFKR